VKLTEAVFQGMRLINLRLNKHFDVKQLTGSPILKKQTLNCHANISL